MEVKTSPFFVARRLATKKCLFSFPPLRRHVRKAPREAPRDVTFAVKMVLGFMRRKGPRDEEFQKHVAFAVKMVLVSCVARRLGTRNFKNTEKTTAHSPIQKKCLGYCDTKRTKNSELLLHMWS